MLAREREMLGARLLSRLLGLLSGASAYHAHASRHAHPAMWSGSPGLGAAVGPSGTGVTVTAEGWFIDGVAASVFHDAQLGVELLGYVV